MARVLILHGWTNRRPEGHWQRHLAAELREAGHIVSYPQMPNPDKPQLAEWLEVATAELKMLSEVGSRAGEELIVVAHSLGCILWMQASDLGLISEVPDRVLFVAPPEPQPVPMPEFETFVMNNHGALRLQQAAKNCGKSLTLVGSDADVWQPSGIQAGVGDLFGLQAVIVPGAKHFSHADGFHRWQGVFDWVQDPHANLATL